MVRTMRFVVCGAKEVGKTCILQQLAYCNDSTQDPYVPTIDDTYAMQHLEHDKNAKDTILVFHDTGGLDATNPDLKRSYLQVADGFVLVYSIDSPDAFNRMDVIKSFIEKNLKDRKEIPMIILANKKDLEQSRQVEREFAMNWAQGQKVKLFEVSAKDRKSLIEPFTFLASKMFPAQKDNKFQLTKRIKDKQPGAAIVMDI